MTKIIFIFSHYYAELEKTINLFLKKKYWALSYALGHQNVLMA